MRGFKYILYRFKNYRIVELRLISKLLQLLLLWLNRGVELRLISKLLLLLQLLLWLNSVESPEILRKIFSNTRHALFKIVKMHFFYLFLSIIRKNIPAAPRSA